MRIIRQALRRLLSPANAILLLVTTLTVGITGPLGTYADLPAPGRVFYWGLVICLSVLLAFVIEEWLGEALAARPLLWREAAIVALFTALFSPLLILVNHLSLGIVYSAGSGILHLVGIVVLVAAMMRVIRNAALPQLHVDLLAPRRPSRAAAGAQAAPGTSAPPARPAMRVVRGTAGDPAPQDSLSPLIRRLQLAPGSRIVSMSVDDHYVEVRDSAGRTHRLLMRFADAVAESEGLNGLLVHRSHWVALDAVAGHRRRGGRDFAILSNGAEVPVSRTYRAALFAARPDLAEIPAEARAGSAAR